MVSLLRRIPRRTVLVLAMAAAAAGAPGLAQAAVHSRGPAVTAAAAAAPSRAAAAPSRALGSAQAAAVTVPAARPAARAASRVAVLLAAQSPDVSKLASGQATVTAASGGVCSVPGIGDIGGLLGFCSLGSSGLTGDLNNICQPSLPDPEPATAGIDSLVRPPAQSAPLPKTLYNQYGVAGQFWAATNMQCSDMTSLIGNNVAGMVFDVAKSIDRVTITVYQSAAGEGILGWLKSSVDRLITSLGNAIYFPYLAVVVIIGAIWLAWQGLIRKRGTRTLEGTIWMVVAAAAAIWLIGRPADFTGMGKTVSDGITQSLDVAFSKLPSPGQGGCVPVHQNDPQAQSSFAFTAGNNIVDQNAGELWAVLVCKPWLDGEFGTTSFAATPGGRQSLVNTYARQLLWAQTIAVNEKPTTALIQAKQAAFAGIAKNIQQKYPGIYPLFQGKQWTTRLEIAFASLFAAVVAGVLVLLIAVTLILLKLGFLLLLVVGPFFLLIGTHPGFGRVVALRWFELLVGVLLKQAAVALVLSVLLYCYALIMGTSDAVLPWALKILMIALVTIAVFIYRRPFQHLFSAVGYGVIGSRDRADTSLTRASTTLRGSTRDMATAAVPGFAAYRAARWARRNPGQATAAAGGPGTGTGRAGQGSAAGAADQDVTGVVAVQDGQPPDLATAAAGSAAGHGAAGNGADAASGGHRPGVAARARSWAASSGDGSGRSAPPLNLPSRDGYSGPPARSSNGNGVAAGNGSRQAGHGVAAGSGGRHQAGPASAPAASPRPAPAPRAAPAPRPAPAPPPAPAWRPAATARPLASRSAAGPDPAAGGTGSRGSAPGRPAAPGHAAGSPAGRPASPAQGSAATPLSGSPAGGEKAAPPTPFWLRPIRRQK